VCSASRRRPDVRLRPAAEIGVSSFPAMPNANPTILFIMNDETGRLNAEDPVARPETEPSKRSARRALRRNGERHDRERICGWQGLFRPYRALRLRSPSLPNGWVVVAAALMRLRPRRVRRGSLVIFAPVQPCNAAAATLHQKESPRSRGEPSAVSATALGSGGRTCSAI
jgi:hypothetical protein